MIDTVIDASVALRWAFEDELDREGATRVATALADGRLRAVVPPNFLLEVAGVLARGIRAGRMTHATADAVMSALLQVSIDEVEPHGFAAASLALALRTGLRVPDATYLETARRRGAILITADRRQLDAAEALGIPAAALSDLPPL